MNELITYINRRIKHAENELKLIKESQGDNPSDHYTYYGGQALGYWQGKLASYEDILYQINENNIMK